ncbi:hypothetical protein U9M48_022951 [Paspalum notatum var. saurae]|uniref:Retrotransposon Copia-like N-terminal domain-containing protein n=1 Tax=Paspalum notatum var. saurae TaxID=547442 RepID=A0AAQ3TKU7_PASNO
MSSSSSSTSASDSDSDASFPIPNTLRVTTDPASPAIVHGINIQSRVPIILDLNDANYTAWVRSFSAVFGQNGLRDHIDGSAPKGDSDWVQNDCAIVSWLYNRIASDLLTVVSSDEDTALSLWRGIRDLFRDNKPTRAVYVNAEFRSLYQGDMSVLAYCTRMKSLADRLADLDAPVTDKDLVHNIIRGLNPRLHHVIPHLTLRKRLPSFLKARSKLQLEEHRLAESEKVQAAAALFAQAQTGGKSSTPSPGATSSQTSSTTTPPAPPQPNSSKKKKKKSASYSAPPPPASTPPAFWPNVNPWTGMVQSWPFHAPQRPASSPGAGVLGPRPSASAPQAHVAGTLSNLGSSVQLDPQLLTALTNLSTQTPTTNGDWFLDTGASSHMTSGSGSAHGNSDSPQ